jgi:hypothetical protein
LFVDGYEGRRTQFFHRAIVRSTGGKGGIVAVNATYGMKCGIFLISFLYDYGYLCLPVMLFLGFPPGMPHFERKSSILAENRGYFQRLFSP